MQSKKQRGGERGTFQTRQVRFCVTLLAGKFIQKQNKMQIKTHSGASRVYSKSPLASALAVSLLHPGRLIVIFFPPQSDFCSFEVRKCQWFLSSVFGLDSFFLRVRAGKGHSAYLVHFLKSKQALRKPHHTPSIQRGALHLDRRFQGHFAFIKTFRTGSEKPLETWRSNLKA